MTRPVIAVPLIGLLGTSIMAVASLVTGFSYVGTQGQRYSPLNHWVSELGQVGVSELAGVFNLSLIIGGLCFALFMAGLAWSRDSRLAWLYGGLGIIAGVAGMFVGVFPMNQLDLHGIAALSFFMLGWISVAIASVDIYRTPEPRLPRWLAYIGAFTVAAFIGFLAVLLPLLGGEGLGAPTVRPSFWIVPVLEWAVIGGLLAWVLLASITWLRALRGDQA